MKEQEFNKLLNESMETPRDLPFDESAWAALETQLDAEQKERKFLFAWWWILPILLGFGLIGWNVVLNKQLSHSKAAIDDLEAKVRLLEEKSINTNTVEKETIIYKTDTVYRYISSQKKAPKNQFKTPSSELFTSSTKDLLDNHKIKNKNNQAKTPVTPFSNQAKKAPLLYPNFSFETAPKTNTIVPTQNDQSKVDLLPPFALTPFPQKTVLDSLIPESYANENLEEKTKFALRPIQFSLGVESGGFAQAKFHQSQLTGTQQGFQGKIDIGTNISLVTAAEWVNVNYTTSSSSTLKTLNDAYSNDVSHVFVNSNAIFDTVNLIKVTSNEKFLQIPIGLQYAFRRTKQFRPTVGGGYVFIKSFENNQLLNLDFAARGTPTGGTNMPTVESVFNYSLQDESTASPSTAWYLNIGFDYIINKNWSIGLQGRTLFESNKNNFIFASANQVSSFDASLPSYGNANPNIMIGVYGSLFYKF